MVDVGWIDGQNDFHGPCQAWIWDARCSNLFEFILDTKMMTQKVPVTPTDSELLLDDDELFTEEDVVQIVMRPDGYYWQATDGKQEVGPFESLELALADAGMDDEEGQEPGETLQEAEDEIGIADWIDPETGEPAEGQSHPRLEE